MKMLSNLPLMLLAVLTLAPLIFFLPATVIRYEVTSDTLPSNSFGEGMTGFNDEFGMDAIPCNGLGIVAVFPKIFSGSMATAYRAWQLSGKILGYIILYFGIFAFIRGYILRKKVRPRKFFMMLVAYIGYMALVIWAVSHQSIPECKPENLYQLISFWPYWPMVVLFVLAIFFAVRSFFLLYFLEKQEATS